MAERTEALARQGEALRQAQRLESIGRLAGGVAHDFNNLLTVVLANASVLLRAVLLPARARVAVEEMRGAAERGANLVRQLLAFSRRQKLAPRVLDLNKLVTDMQRLLQPADRRDRRAQGDAGARAGAGQGRLRPAGAGDHQPGHQRARRHARRGAS